MLSRVLEPEVMDTEEDARAYDAMDFDEANGRFADDALGLMLALRAPRVVDLGTGTAAIPIAMVQRLPDLRIVAVDLASSMLSVARERIARAAVGHAIDLVKADVKGTGLPAGSFDLVMANSTAHHLPHPGALFQEAVRLLRPGGALIIRDLYRPLSAEDAWATVNRVSPNDGPLQRGLFFDSLCAALTLDEVRALACEAGLTDARIEIVSDRHWTVERPARLDVEAA